MEINILRNFHIFHQPLHSILLKLAAIDEQLERKAIDDLNLGRRERIQLLHALHLLKSDIIPILELMPLILMHSDDHVLLVALRGGHDEGLGLLSVGVVDLEFGAVVEEGESAGAEVLGEDEAFGVGVAVFVKGGDFVDVG